MAAVASRQAEDVIERATNRPIIEAERTGNTPADASSDRTHKPMNPSSDNTGASAAAAAADGAEPPIMDLSRPEAEVTAQIAQACSTWGFFQVINHGVPLHLVDEFKSESQKFFDLPRKDKLALKRNARNARGYFDDELTKQRRDWKEAIDIGMPGSRNWSIKDDDVSNGCLDGFNRFPPEDLLPNYRPTVVKYFTACQELSHRISILMANGLGVQVESEWDDNGDEKKSGEEGKAEEGGTTDDEDAGMIATLREQHTSYLRTNFYPPFIPGETALSDSEQPPPLGISPHKDAGFVTVLVQDDDCHSLQVAQFENGDESLDPTWRTVHPVPGAFTINTGDMAMIWSNGRYRAPLHRVLTATATRISAPFFYNPGFAQIVRPAASLKEKPMYHPCSWGYFRAVRFAGDFTDIGVEIQITDFLCKEEQREESEGSPHLRRQEAFLRGVDFAVPFDIDQFRALLEG